MAEEFKILDARTHARERIGMYLGSVSNDTISRFVKGQWRAVTYVPAVFKMINEILDNSIDEAIRTDFKFATKIDVTIKDGAITVTDNGRGIPQGTVLDTTTGERILQPVAAWTKTNAGTSFDNERKTAGTNGLGSAAANFLSTSFIGETWRDKKLIRVACTNGAEKVDVTEAKHGAGSGTKVTFTPDLSFFECEEISGDIVELVEDRLMSMQLAFPEIAFSMNGVKMKTDDFRQYAKMFAVDGASIIIEKTDDVSFFFAASVDGFRNNSFVNGVNTYLGGTYVDFLVNGVADELIAMIKRKHKIEVTRSTVKNGLSFVLFVRNFVNPKFDGQTKEKLSNSLGQVKEHYGDRKDAKTIAKKIFAADDIIKPLIEAQLAKKNADERRDAIVAQKKLKKVRVAKHIAASGKDGRLLLTEGDCVHEDTKVYVLNRGSVRIADVEEGDMVLTHKNRFMPVQAKNFALKDGYTINGKIMSGEHRLFVYDTTQDKFDFVQAKDIDKDVHKLVRNRLVYHGVERAVNYVEDVYHDSGVVITDKNRMKFSAEHDILCLVGGDIVSKKLQDIAVGDVILL